MMAQVLARGGYWRRLSLVRNNHVRIFQHQDTRCVHCSCVFDARAGPFDSRICIARHLGWLEQQVPRPALRRQPRGVRKSTRRHRVADLIHDRIHPGHGNFLLPLAHARDSKIHSVSGAKQQASSHRHVKRSGHGIQSSRPRTFATTRSVHIWVAKVLALTCITSYRHLWLLVHL